MSAVIEGGTTRRVMRTLILKELRETYRNRWFLLFSVMFALLSLALSYMSVANAGLFGLSGFGRTAAVLINLVVLIVPLMSVMVGATAVAGEEEQGTLAYLFAQPVSRLEVVVAKYVGVGGAVVSALCMGFGISGLVIGLRGGGDFGPFAGLVGFTILLSLAMLSCGIFVSARFGSTGAAVGGCLMVWFALIFLSDLGLMGTAVIGHVDIGTLFYLALLNPVQVFKVAAIASLGSGLDILGPAGQYAVETYGSRLIEILVGVLAAWALVPLVLTFATLKGKDV